MGLLFPANPGLPRPGLRVFLKAFMARWEACSKNNWLYESWLDYFIASYQFAWEVNKNYFLCRYYGHKRGVSDTKFYCVRCVEKFLATDENNKFSS